MGPGSYLAGRGDAEHDANERRRELMEVAQKPEAAEVAGLFRACGLGDEETDPVVSSLSKRLEAWVHFMTRFELDLEKPDPGPASTSVCTLPP